VAFHAGISLDTLRKIERGAIATPAFFTVAALAKALDLDLTTLAAAVTDDGRPGRLAS
jgi:transcriptional regulator with XRE-family HTH domain